MQESGSKGGYRGIFARLGIYAACAVAGGFLVYHLSDGSTQSEPASTPAPASQGQSILPSPAELSAPPQSLPSGPDLGWLKAADLTWAQAAEKARGFTEAQREGLRIELAKILSSPMENNVLSRNAMRAAGVLQVRNPEALDAMQKLACEGKEPLAAIAAISTGLIAQAKADLLFAPLFSNPEPAVRAEACGAAGLIQGDWAWPNVKNALEDQSPRVREQAIWALLNFPGHAKEIEAAVAKLAGRESGPARTALLAVIGKLRIEAGMDALLAAARDNSPLSPFPEFLAENPENRVR